ncbi:MAG: hypothetical protein HGA85_01780 [Nanoarchaeota archaeon]|nr:hypothetical protein [Nanoarchaeota archaeon]
MKVWICLLLVLAMSVANAEEVVVFNETFDDGDFTNNPAGFSHNGNCQVIDGVLSCEGIDLDGSGRRVSWIRYFPTINLSDTFTFTMSGRLQSTPGNDGRGIQFILSGVNISNGERYDLKITKGYTDNSNTNHNSLSLGYAKNGIMYDYLFLDNPLYNQTYILKGKRDEDSFYFFVNDNMVGITNDTLKIDQIIQLDIATTGSVLVDNLTIINNPEPEAEEEESLLSQFSPVISLHPDEYYFPKAVESVLDNSDLKRGQAVLVNAPISKNTLLGIEEPWNTNLDMRNVDLTSPLGLLDPREVESYPTKIYGREIKDGMYTHLQYYMFYPFQNWYGMNHESDWEMVQVTLNAINRIESVSYVFGPFTMVYYDMGLITLVDGTHPLVTVAKGSHNNYADDQEIRLDLSFLVVHNLLGKFKELDMVKSGGPQVLPETLATDGELSYVVEDISSNPGWINYQGQWGEKEGSGIKNGPRSPRFNNVLRRKWTHPEDYTYKPDYPFMSAFIYSPVDMSFQSQGQEVDLEGEKTLFYTGNDAEPKAVMLEGDNFTLHLDSKEEGQFTLDVFLVLEDSA